MRFIRNLYRWLPRFRLGAGLATAEERRRLATMFLLCGFYCLIAIAMLGYFGVQALLAGNEGYGRVLLGFAGVTGVCYVLIWVSGALFLANHMVTLLMGLLCLYLFQSGGVAGTGPLWYFVFPPLALFLQGTRTGLILIGLLFACTALLVLMGQKGLGLAQYEGAFLQRMTAVYVAVSALGLLFAHFRDESERQLRETNQQLAALSGYDPVTGLISRRRAEIVMEVEARKFDRYQTGFCFALFKVDNMQKLREKHGPELADIALQDVALLLKQEVRYVDLLSRWDADEFGVLLPATSLKGAVGQAERIRLRVTRLVLKSGSGREPLTLSAGVGQFRGTHASRFVHEVREQLAFAVSTGGNCVMYADL